jgi:ornithine cyclodeaminase
MGGEVQKSGIKWISSFPENTASNLARASAVLILNDATTGYPLGCFEASVISSTRTAASAALAAEHLSPTPFKGTLSVIGTGVIARATIEWLMFRNWQFDKVNLFDLNREDAERFGGWVQDEYGLAVEIRESVDDAATDGSLIVFTTTAPEPYFKNEAALGHAPTVLHLSLRDIGTNIVLGSQNIVDDVDHCLKARTSLHLTEMESGNRDFIAGTLFDVLERKVLLDDRRPRIFSPFGLGVLDIAVGSLVLEAAKSSDGAIALPDFFSNAARW